MSDPPPPDPPDPNLLILPTRSSINLRSRELSSSPSGSHLSQDSTERRRRRVTFPALSLSVGVVSETLVDMIDNMASDRVRVVGDSHSDEGGSGASLETECLLIKYQTKGRSTCLGIPSVDFSVLTTSTLLLLISNISLIKVAVLHVMHTDYLHAVYTIAWILVNMVVTGVYRFRRRTSNACCKGLPTSLFCRLLRVLTFTDPIFLARYWIREAKRKANMKYHVKDKRKGTHNRHWLAQRLMTANTHAVSQMKVSCLIASGTYCWQVPGMLLALADPTVMTDHNDMSLIATVVVCVVTFCWAMCLNLPRRRSHLMVEDESWILYFGSLKFTWLLLFTMSRLLAYHFFAKVFLFDLLLVCFLQWLIVYVTMIFYSPPASRNIFISICIYKPLLASLYLLGFVNTQRGYMESLYGFYYMACFLFNLFLMYMALEGNGGSLTMVIVSSVIYCVGFAVMITSVMLRLRILKRKTDVEIVIDD